MATKKRTTVFLLGVTALLTLVKSDNESQAELLNNPPIGAPENVVIHPEVVLQLKYDGGALERISLSQFRQRDWRPSVSARSNLCSDLCHAGLGGDGCGKSCKDLIPVGLQSTLTQLTHNASDYFGEPRASVCPTLCTNKLGYPLCNCRHEEMDEGSATNWGAVCYAFCASDRYILGGCPPCDIQTTSPSIDMIGIHPHILAASDGWSAWCNIQCRQGHGGAACNCDRTPFQ